MNDIIINDRYTDIIIKFGLEDIEINIYKFAKDFLREHYDIDFKIHFDLVDKIEDENGVTSGMFIVKEYISDGKILYSIADRIELLKPFFEYFHSKVLLNTIKHELIHYALFEKYKEGWSDGDDLFESECIRLGVK